MLVKSTQLAHVKVRQGVLEMIEHENLCLGDRLPSERNLASHFNCTQQTVQRALLPLVSCGVISRRIGSGTYLAAFPDGDLEKRINCDSVVKAESAVNCDVGILLVPNKSSHFINEFLTHLQQESHSRKLRPVMYPILNFGKNTIDLCKALKDEGCRAILIPTVPDPVPTEELLTLVQNSTIPVVFGKPLPGLEKYASESLATFGRPDTIAIEWVCRYFKAIGYQNIAYLGPEAHGDFPGHRLLVYTRFAARENLTPLVGLVGNSAGDIDFTVDKWAQFAGSLGIICFDDDHAIRLMTSIHKKGLRIPQDMAVFGFNNLLLCNSTDPPLSTIQFAYDYLAQIMLEHALAMAEGGSCQGQGKAPVKMIIRESCGGFERFGDELNNVLFRLNHANASIDADISCEIVRNFEQLQLY